MDLLRAAFNLGNALRHRQQPSSDKQRHRQVGDTPLTDGDAFRMGSATVRTDGTSSYRSGNLTVHSDGVTSIEGGGTTLNSDGTASYSCGATTIHSDGSASFRMPGSNMVVNTDGSINFVY